MLLSELLDRVRQDQASQRDDSPTRRGPIAGRLNSYKVSEHGEIRVNTKNSSMAAHCSQHGCQNVSCRKTQTYNSSSKKPHQGRPVGFLVAWLNAAPQFASKDDHLFHTPAFEARSRARAELKATGLNGELFALERARRDGEEDEPET